MKGGIFGRLRPTTRSARIACNFEPVDLDIAVAASFGRRFKGLLGNSGAALLIYPCNSVHSIGMSRGLDVAYLDASGRVLDQRLLRPWRMHLPRKNAVAVLETSVGLMAARGIVPGATISIADVSP